MAIDARGCDGGVCGAWITGPVKSFFLLAINFNDLDGILFDREIDRYIKVADLPITNLASLASQQTKGQPHAPGPRFQRALEQPQ
jgi:hypothetical protein